MNIRPLALIGFLVFPPAASAQATPPLEQAVWLSASDLLDPSLLQGTAHRVRDSVYTDGYMAHFQIDTDFGTFDAIGVPQVSHRIAEAEAVRQLAEVSKSDLFAEGLKRSIEQPIDAVKNIVTNPVESVKGVPKTVGHFFSKAGASIERGVRKVKDSAEAEESPSTADVGRGLARGAMNIAGFDKARLDTARQLGVDPYSDNVRLQEEMDKVTWAFFAGGLPLRIGAAAASAGTAVTATQVVGIPEETYALTQSELALRDQRSLAAMGLRAEDIQTFQVHPSLSTTRRHRIVTALEALPGAAGRGKIILLANACESPEQADFLVAALSMLGSRQSSGAADYKELHVFGRLAGAVTSTGLLEVPAPVDYVTWTEQVASFAERDDLGTAPKVLLHTGQLSAAAAEGFSARGWKTVQLAYPGT
jgi:hypothetical protein